MEQRHANWFDERDMGDAPVWLNADEANAWASGWNGAVRACTDQQDAIFAREMGNPNA